MSNYLKYFKSEFEKHAQGYGPPPRRHQGVTPATPSAPRTLDQEAAPRKHMAPPNDTVVNPAPLVKKMQSTLIELAQSVSSQINVQNIAPGNNQMEQGEAESRNSFNNFIVKHPLRESDVPGVELDPDPKKTQMNQKTPSQPTRMTTIMDTMSRIGNSKTGELSADGKWGPRTNAALHNAYAFAFSMLKLADSFKIQITSYDQKQLAELKSLIPSDEDVTPVLKLDAASMEKAATITNNLKNIERMYGEIKSGILENPGYQTYIEGDTPFASYKKSQLPLTQQEKQMHDQLSAGNPQFNRTFPFFVQAPNAQPGTGMNGQISLADLVSPEAFQKWYYSPNNSIREDTSLIFNAIRQALQKAGQAGT